MRPIQMLLSGAGMVLLGVAGCQHQPDLKPPEQPEVLVSPGDRDKRYGQPQAIPAEVLANDPYKLKTKQDNNITPMRGGRTPGMGGMGPGY